MSQSHHQPNILTNHIRFSSGVIETMAPDTKFVTIVRDPYFQFISAFEYFHQIDVLNSLPRGKEGMKEFFSKPWEYYNNHTKYDGGHWGHWLAKNVNFFDLGYSNKMSDMGEINKTIEKINKQFELVMISDYMDESLILLKNELCLETRDILYFSINKRAYKNGKPNYDPELARQIREWTLADHILFERANETFWKKIEKFGIEKMNLELELLEKENL